MDQKQQHHHPHYHCEEISKHHHPHYHCEEISWYSSSMEKTRLFWTILSIKILTQITPLMKWKKEKEHILTTHKSCFLQYIRLVPVNIWESRMRSRILIDIERDQEFLSIYIEQSRFFTRFIVSLCVCVCVCVCVWTLKQIWDGIHLTDCINISCTGLSLRI